METSDDEYDDGANGTPKAPRLSIKGRPDRTCPGAPSKGKAPHRFLHLSADAPVRRLKFLECGSPVSSDDHNMLTDIDAAVSPARQTSQDNGVQQLQYSQQQHEHQITQHQMVVEQGQQLFQGLDAQQQHLHQQQQHSLLQQPHHHQLQSQQQQQPQQPMLPQQTRPRQLFNMQDMPHNGQLQQNQQLLPHQQQQQFWSPLSPAAGSARQQLTGEPPNRTPARLFR